jgi:arylsulfatase A-like enzyme
MLATGSTLSLLVPALATIVLALVPAGRARAAERPNVVLVMLDDIGLGDLACLGDPVVKTPHLDRLHAESVRLTDFHVDPTCAPTRAALMTGRYSTRAGVWHTVMMRSYLARDEVTMADVFRHNGYRTGIFGKWHLGHNYPYRAEHRGFQENLVLGDGGLATPNDYWGNDRFDDVYFRDAEPVPTDGFCTDVFFDHAMQFIRDATAGPEVAPFFLYLPTNTAHLPWYVPERYRAMYPGHGELTDFYATITKIDENMGRLLAMLDQEQLTDNTVLIFLTDNGTAGRDPANYNAGLRKHKGSEYDGGHRVPCFIRYPRGRIGGSPQAARDVDRLTAHIDLLPTLVELCQLDLPRPIDFDGRSLMPLLRPTDAPADTADVWPDRAIGVHVGRTDFLEKGRRWALMTERWRLVGGDELYDMTVDQGQKNNVADEHPTVVARLRREYDRWWDRISEGTDGFARAVLGAEDWNRALLTIQDWHGPDGRRTASSKQTDIAAGIVRNGFWTVEFARPGIYEFELRRWPVELDTPIRAAVDGGKALPIRQAKIRIDGPEWDGPTIEQQKPVDTDDRAVVFRIELPAGKARLMTWLLDERKTDRGAYLVYVKRLSPKP